MKKDITNFYGEQSLSKTMRFELKPCGDTLKNIKESGFLEDDQERTEAYKTVKELMDRYHRNFIEQTLSGCRIEWEKLYDALVLYRKDSSVMNREKLEKVQAKYRKEISKKFSQTKSFKEMFKADMITKLLPEMALTEKEMAAVKRFDKFSTYFTGFYETRKNVYSSEDIATSVPRRIVHENFNRYVSNLTAIQKIFLKFPEVISQAKKELSSLPDYEDTDLFFALNGYNICLSQRGINQYNKVIGEINMRMNLYTQQDKEKKIKRREYLLQPLYKQILSEKENLSFVNEIIESDEQVIDLLDRYLQELEQKRILQKMSALFGNLDQVSEGIYLTKISLNEVSRVCFNNWAVINDVLREYAEATFASKKLKDAYMKRKEFSLLELNTLLIERRNANILTYFQETEVLITKFSDVIKSYQKESRTKGKLKEVKAKKDAVKMVCDTVMELLHYVKPFAVSEDLERDLEFYETFDEIYIELDQFVKLYNRIRNYMTKKSYSEEKSKLNFDCPTLAAGWDQNKQQANAAIILMKDEKYFLGILNTKKKPKIDDYVDKSLDCNAPGVYKKMVYKLLPGPNKMLPKVFFSKKGIEQFQPPQEILDGYQQEKHKKGDAFDLEFCWKLIDFFKENIEKYPGWNEFGFHFSPTESYTDISQFYKEVAEQGYKISFEAMREEMIEKLVNDGSLFLFQIYNKDFAPGAKGTPNLHTLYWKALFSEENLSDVIFKLNGEAELFFRKRSIDTPFIHKKGTKYVNKRLIDNSPIEDQLYREIFAYVNGKTNSLSTEAEKIMPNVVVKDVDYEIMKDRRYTLDKFFFHVPITVNFKAKDNYNLNRQVNAYIKENPKVHIIGLDRGERNLLYMSLIDQNGNLIEQREFNVINDMDYQQKLDQREKERDASRKSWENIAAIKELKTGYLSQVIHEITELMVENNAIIVMEDLNFGFKRGRFRIEKQVYQKFEKMLIDKLNYLVTDKKKDWGEPGGVLKGLQLTNKFVSFERMGKQNGFLYYVPASYTSKIDPTTGFANIFNMAKLTNFAARKDFFSRFDSICYDENVEMFAFSFDYSNFDCLQSFKKTKWTVYTVGERLHNYRDRQSGKWCAEPPLDISNRMKEVFEEAGINYAGTDLCESIRRLEDNPVNGKLLSDLLFLFKMTLQMRNSDAKEDYIISCVKNQKGEFFDSRQSKPEGNLPCDADANGAYHIALKGKMIIDRINGGCDEKALLRISNEEWFSYAQSKGEI